MATIRLKRRANGGAAGAPPALATTEVAYNETDDILYLGYGDDGASNATTIRPLAGAGRFVDRATDQTLSGVKTFVSSPLIPNLAGSDNSQAAANTAWVKALGYLNANQTITVSGDASGSGNTAISLTLSNSGVTAGTYPKVTVDAKGRVTAGTTLAATDIPTLTASKISDFDTQVRMSTLNQMALPTADVSLNSKKITGLADPVAATDAANKQYVDNLAAGLKFKASVLAATTANITLSGTQTIDGVAVAAGNRILVKSQTTTSQNGIYLVATGAWTRATDADAWSEMVSAFVFVERGTTNADTAWVCTVNQGGTLGTTAVTWTQFAGGSGVTAGAGLTQTGSTIDVVGTANRITANTDNIDIASTYVGQTSITTLGTVSTGTWQGSAVAASYGGTGLTSVINGMVKGNGTGYSVAAAGTDYLAPSSTIDGGTF